MAAAPLAVAVRGVAGAVTAGGASVALMMISICTFVRLRMF
jgi:hypothetical protein